MPDVLHPRQARLEKREARLHEHHEDGRDDHPHRARGNCEPLVVMPPPPPPACARPRVGVTLLDRRRPDDPVTRLVAAARGVDDRVDHRSCDLVVDDERQHRLRQEARLEHAPAVLVRDPTLTAVTDRLDDGHAHMPRLLLDRVDHRLDALADDDGLDLGHPILLDRRLDQHDVSPDAVQLSEPARARPRRESRTARGARGCRCSRGRSRPGSSRCPRPPRAISASSSARPTPTPVRQGRRRRCISATPA